MDWASRWGKMTEAQQYQDRVAKSLQAKLRANANLITETSPGDYNVKIGDQVVPGVSRIRAAELVLEYKYGIRIKIQKMHPFKFEQMPDSQPIMSSERGAVTPKFTLQEAEAILQEIERELQYIDDSAHPLATAKDKLHRAIKYTKEWRAKAEEGADAPDGTLSQ